MGVHDQTARLASGRDGGVRRLRIAGSQLAPSNLIVPQPFTFSEGWFSGHADSKSLRSAGFRLTPGGTHLSRTIMLAELRHVLEAEAQPTPDRLRSLVLDENVLQKRTGSARRLSLRHLRELYGLGAPPPILRAMMYLWPKAGEGQPILALLAALAREALLRDSAEIILPALAGARVHAADFADSFEGRYSDYYTVKMLAKISRNCASSWTQSGHLRGRVRKVRRKAAANANGCRLCCAARVACRLWRSGAPRIALDRGS
jgi:hypothetical protein